MVQVSTLQSTPSSTFSLCEWTTNHSLPSHVSWNPETVPCFLLSNPLSFMVSNPTDISAECGSISSEKLAHPIRLLLFDCNPGGVGLATQVIATEAVCDVEVLLSYETCGGSFRSLQGLWNL